MRVVELPVKNVGQEFRQYWSLPRVIEENKVGTNDYFGKSNQYTGLDYFNTKLNLSSIIGTDGYLKGSLSSSSDVDYYEFSLGIQRLLGMSERYNYDTVIKLDNIPEGCDYNIILYDQNGNQVGVGRDDGNGGKIITVPNWDANHIQFTVKVEAKDGSNVDPSGYYHISFEMKPADKNSLSYQQSKEKSPILGEVRKKLHDGEDYTAEKEMLAAIDQKYESIYLENLTALHQEQADELLPGDADCSEDKIAELILKMEQGEELSEEEKMILLIFASAQWQDGIAAGKNLNESVLPEIQSLLEKAGMDMPAEPFSIYVDSYGNVTVEGIEDLELKRKLEEILKNYSSTLLEAYVMMDKSMQELPKQEKDLINAYQEVQRFLYKATDGAVSLNDLSLGANGEILGLPSNISNLINNPGNNVTYWEYRQDILEILDYQRRNNVDFLFINAAFEVNNAGVKVKS